MAEPDRLLPSATPPVLRTGRKVRRTVYVQRGESPSDADRLVGLVDSRQLAAALCVAFNEHFDVGARVYLLGGLDD